ncbi:hypothetical protein FA743_10950 [Paracoccus gahaiensis]|uniref:Bacteriophage tail tape measure N-terminal domain-containing protein n=1 Tax=Paracoccus gahaiensis TaxID=1706839 RepID=A0A4U0R9T8_9RHOB|nr:hypothetical protein [Paracoccus gahaiensis]TJZ91606.1 hypothetical protein FA743_10950 [Paracoccus gahaiensis]
MAEAEAGLILPIGLTEQKFLQQLARLEAKAIGAARKSEQGFVKGNQQISKSFGSMSGQARNSLQNVGYQLQDIFVQIEAGQGTARALGQQLPQLLAGFGVLGGALGLVAAAGIPLAASFFGAGEEAKGLDDALKDLNSSLDEYYSAVEAANAPTAELVEKYGLAAGAAQRLLVQLAEIAKIDAISSLRDSADAISTTFQGALDTLARIDAAQGALAPEDFLNEGTAAQRALTEQTQMLQEEYALTVDQARELRDLLADQQAAATPEAMADAMLRLSEFLTKANSESGYLNDNLRDGTRQTITGTLAASELSVALSGAASASGDIVANVAQIPGSIDAATASAINLTRALGAAIQAANSVSGTIGIPSLGRFGNGESITARAGGLDLQEQQTFRYDWQEQMAAAEAARAKAARAGGGGRKGRSGGAGKEERPFFENMERDLLNLERELTLIGKTNEEIAVAEARWELLDEAKKRGIPVNAELSAQIDAQAEQFGRLTAELEAAEKSQAQFEDAIDGIADAMAGALVAGESLRDGLAQVLKGIASDILTSGIRSALAGQFGGGGGGGLLSGAMNFLAGGGDKLTGALRLAGARANGGPVSGGSAYLVGERGPEVIVPRNSGMVIPNNQLGGGQSVLMVDLSPDLEARILSEAKGQSVQISQQAATAQGRVSANLTNQKTGSRRRV